MHIGVAGIGKMGAAIAARLMEVGHEVTVWNRTPDKAKAVSGATMAATPAELAQQSEAIITILTDGSAIEAVYNGASGLLSAGVTGKLFIEMSTVPPKVETALAPKVKPGARSLLNVRSAARPRRRGKASCLASSAAMPMPRLAHFRSSISYAARSSIAARSAPALP